MVKHKFTSLVFPSLKDLDLIIAQSQLETSYELAKARLPEQTLLMRAVGKFHEIVGELKRPSVDDLAQIELVDVPSDEGVTNSYKNALIENGYGRISIVGKEGTTYELSTQLGLLMKLPERILSLKPLIERLARERDFIPREELYIKLVTFQDEIHKLSDLRTTNGFSSYENSVYGNGALFCHLFALVIKDYFERTYPEIKAKLDRSPLKSTSGLTMEKYLDLQRLVKSEKGVNLPVYFMPRVKPEEVTNVIR